MLLQKNAEDNSPVINILNDIREMWRLMVALKSVEIIRPKEPLEIHATYKLADLKVMKFF